MLEFARPTSHDLSRAKEVTVDGVVRVGFIGSDEGPRRRQDGCDDLRIEEFSTVSPVEACGEM
jgi:hypothetical protein